MKEIYGIGASNGISMGNLRLFYRNENITEKLCIDNPESELARLKIAQHEAVDELNKIYLQSLQQVGNDDSMIFKIQIMMLNDEDFTEAIREKVEKEHVNAEYAVQATGKEFADRFSLMDDEYMQARADDVIDISKRFIQCLNKTFGEKEWQCSEPSVLAAEELTSSEAMQLDKSKILATITRNGSSTSHLSILTRTMEIPSVIDLGKDFDCLKDGMFVIVDGKSGEIILEPDETTKQIYEKKANEHFLNRQKLKILLNSNVITKNGKTIEINANIGTLEDVKAALENGADGIGLFRSEFLFMNRDCLPSEEEQFQVYKTVLERMEGRSVIVRTFDIGADKQVPYLSLPKEANPAMGYRAIRICLDRKDLFFTQLKALLRASVFGNLKIMFPMITSSEEVSAAKAALEEVKTYLASKGIEYSPNVKVGIMIETPAAVMLSEELAMKCDFFSIGTNDLTQYTLAVDRMNNKISKLYDQSHPAVLKMIQLTAENAHKAGIPVGICGESAAETSLAGFYVKNGIDELSVAPSSILEVKEMILKVETN